MRASPRFSQQTVNVRTVRRHRRNLIIVTITVALLTVAASWVGTSLNSPGASVLERGTLARVVGPSGSATAAVVSDNSLVSDGQTFATQGETVTVRFDGGPEFRGTVSSIVMSSGAQRLPVAVITLLDGAIAPATVSIGVFAGNEGEKGLIACVTEDVRLQHERIRLPAAGEAMPAPVETCGAGAAFLADTEGHELLGLSIRDSTGRLRIVPIEAVELP